MKYLLSKQFTQIAETTGTIQNASHFETIEMSNSNTPDSGILIAPLQRITFSGRTIYLRCVDGWAEARVIPFIVDSGSDSSSSGTQSSGSTVDDSQVATDEEIEQVLNDVFG